MSSRLGAYWIERKPARGGMGVVCRARTGDGLPVALTLLLTSRADHRKRFEREAQPALTTRAQIGCERRDPERAVEPVRASAWLAPNDREAQVILARALREAGRPEQARATQSRARALPRDPTLDPEIADLTRRLER